MSTRCPFALALLAAAAGLAGCARKPPEPVKTPPPVVIVDRPVVQKVNDYEDFAGRTEPFKVVELKSRVTGYLKAIHFKDGQDIEGGKPLFDIDDRTYKAELGKAKATLHKAREHLKTTTNTYTLVRQAYESGGESKDKLDIAAGDMAEAGADVELALAELELAETNLKFCNITAPFDGRLSQRRVDEGNLVKADETSLTTIVRLDEVYATFDVDERTVLRIRKLIFSGGAKSSRTAPLAVRVALADDDDFTLTGQIYSTDNQIDAGTGTLRVRATIPNPRLAVAPWYLLSPGQFVRIRLPIGPPRDAVLVPEKAIGSDQGQRFVYVVNGENAVERRNVRVGQQYGQSRVIEDGVLSPADRVIVEGLLRVRPGVEVNPKPAPPSKAPPSAPVVPEKAAATGAVVAPAPRPAAGE